MLTAVLFVETYDVFTPPGCVLLHLVWVGNVARDQEV